MIVVPVDEQHLDRLLRQPTGNPETPEARPNDHHARLRRRVHGVPGWQLLSSDMVLAIEGSADAPAVRAQEASSTQPPRTLAQQSPFHKSSDQNRLRKAKPAIGYARFRPFLRIFPSASDATRRLIIFEPGVGAASGGAAEAFQEAQRRLPVATLDLFPHKNPARMPGARNHTATIPTPSSQPPSRRHLAPWAEAAEIRRSLSRGLLRLHR